VADLGRISIRAPEALPNLAMLVDHDAAVATAKHGDRAGFARRRAFL
jgi:hypothetical protein